MNNSTEFWEVKRDEITDKSLASESDNNYNHSNKQDENPAGVRTVLSEANPFVCLEWKNYEMNQNDFYEVEKSN